MTPLNKKDVIAGLIIAFVTFFIALIVGIGSELFLKIIKSIWLALIFLLFIISVGVFFDVIGTAVTAATIPPLNAKASQRILGAEQAVRLVRNAGSVANYCNDIIGDVAGTLSGATGAAIVIKLSTMFPLTNVALVSAMMTSFIAALTVGGKAIGKEFSLANANNIILKVATVIAYWEKLTGIIVFPKKKGRKWKKF